MSLNAELISLTDQLMRDGQRGNDEYGFVGMPNDVFSPSQRHRTFAKTTVSNYRSSSFSDSPFISILLKVFEPVRYPQRIKPAILPDLRFLTDKLGVSCRDAHQ